MRCMRAALLAILAAAAAASAVAAAAPAAAAARHCTAASIGPGARHAGGRTGATCLLTAFQNGCRAAGYTLSAFGVDTVHAERFVTARRHGHCVVVVTETMRIVPQQPHVIGRHTCTRVHRVGAGIVADRCTPKRTVSLTTLAG
jgi:hypothetical protein